MKLTIQQFYENLDCHKCLDENGEHYLIDLNVDGTFPEFKWKQNFEEHKNIVGRKIEVEEITPILYTGKNIKFI